MTWALTSLLVIGFSLGSVARSSSSLPTFSVDLTPLTVEMISDIHQNLSVEFNGSVELQKTDVRQYLKTYRVDVSAWVDSSWECYLNQSVFIFENSGTQEFKCTVIIPIAQNTTSTKINYHGNLSEEQGSPLAGSGGWNVIRVQKPLIDEVPPKDNRGSSNMILWSNLSILIIVIVIIIILIVIVRRKYGRLKKKIKPGENAVGGENDTTNE